MEQRGAAASSFEDRPTLAMVNRNLAAPTFTSSVTAGVLTIQTAEVALHYTVGQPFSASTLWVESVNASSAFTTWHYGDANPGNLLGTIRGLDMQNQTPLNCTQNAGIDDNGEFNHCEWGLISRNGWVVYDDSINYCMDASTWWWSMDGQRSCLAPMPGTDAVNPTRSVNYPNGLTVTSQDQCCAACMADPTCLGGYVFDTNADSPNCWPLSGFSGTQNASSRVLVPAQNPSHNTDEQDLYGFFHGHDYFGALRDFVQVGGSTIMVPRYVSGVWWSRWFDINNYDTRKIVEDYESRRIPLDVFVIDMDWHTKDNWSGELQL